MGADGTDKDLPIDDEQGEEVAGGAKEFVDRAAADLRDETLVEGRQIKL